MSSRHRTIQTTLFTLFALLAASAPAMAAPPFAWQDSYVMPSNGVLEVADPGILANDRDPDGDTLTVASHTPVTNGSVVVNPGGGFTYTPNSGYVGAGSFTYTASDGSATSNSTVVYIKVHDNNRAPVASGHYYTVQEGAVLTVDGPGGVLSNSADPDHDWLTAKIDTNPTNGTLSLSPDGSFVYTPNPLFNGDDSFTYKVTDSVLDSNVATVHIKVFFVNQPPVANDDSYSVAQDTVLQITRPGVLANDRDPEQHVLGNAQVVTPPSHGTAALGVLGSLVYSPAPGFSGTDTFTYKMTDGALESNVATVTITVNPGNRAPVANDDSYSVAQDGGLSVPYPGLVGNDTDPDNDFLDVQIVTQPANGVLSLAPRGGGFFYQNNQFFSGTDTFTYKATDGHLESNVATVTITVNAVNQAPVANDDLYSVAQDTTLEIKTRAAGVFGNDTDPEGDFLRLYAVETNPAHGVLSLGYEGEFTYAPDAGFSGTDTFRYQVWDGHTVSAANVRIDVTANQPPVANDDSYSIAQDQWLIVSYPGLLANDTDPENHALSVQIVTQPANGVLSVAPVGGGFSYKNNQFFSGTDTFTYRVNDGDLDSNVATVTITVNPDNQAPVANDDLYSVPQDTRLAINTRAAGVFGNDTDPEGDFLRLYAVETRPAHGVLSLGYEGEFTYVPGAGFSGTDTFRYQVWDGHTVASANVTLVVNATNQPPVANDDYYAAHQNGLLIVAAPGLLENDSDPEGHPLKVTLLTPPANGFVAPEGDGGFEYVPNTDFTGIDNFTYRVNDGKLNSSIATVRIVVVASATNLPPVANNDVYAAHQNGLLTVAAPGLLANDSDPEGHALKVVVVTQPANGTLALTTGGGFNYTPDTDYTGLDSFTYKANDGKLNSDTATVFITVTGGDVNQPPVANDDAYAAHQNGLLTVAAPGLLANDSDPEGHALKVVVVTQPANGTLALTTGGGFSYTPDTDFTGTDTFTYRANDGKLDSNTATVQISVVGGNVNLPPVAVPDSYATTQDRVLSVAAPGLLINDSDPEDHALKVIVVTQPGHGHLVLTGGGGFDYLPDPGFRGDDTFTYRANDGKLDSNTETVQITVTAAPLPVPTLGPIGMAVMALLMLFVGLYGSTMLAKTTGVSGHVKRR